MGENITTTGLELLALAEGSVLRIGRGARGRWHCAGASAGQRTGAAPGLITRARVLPVRRARCTS
jgi:hypothetical protein